MSKRLKLNGHELCFEYDAGSDVLYVSVIRPAPARSEEPVPGLILRYDIESGEAVGATIVDFDGYWRSKLSHLADAVGEHLHVPRDATYEALREQLQPSAP